MIRIGLNIRGSLGAGGWRDLGRCGLGMGRGIRGSLEEICLKGRGGCLGKEALCKMVRGKGVILYHSIDDGLLY